MTFNTTVAGNALTINTDAGTLTIPAGSALGTTSGVPFRLWVTNNGGLAANAYSGPGFLKRPKKPLGSLTWETGLPVAGQWSSVPTTTETWIPGDALPGDTIEALSFPNMSGAGITNGPTGMIATPIAGSIVSESAADLIAVSCAAVIALGNVTHEIQYQIQRGGLPVGMFADLGNYEYGGPTLPTILDFPGMSGTIGYALYISVIGAYPVIVPSGGGSTTRMCGIMSLQRIKG